MEDSNSNHDQNVSDLISIIKSPKQTTDTTSVDLSIPSNKQVPTPIDYSHPSKFTSNSQSYWDIIWNGSKRK